MCLRFVSVIDIVPAQKISKPILFSVDSRKNTSMPDMLNKLQTPTKFVHGVTTDE